MSESNAENRRFRLGKVDWIFLGVIVVMMLISVGLTLLQRGGLTLADAALTLYLPLLAVAAVAIWIMVILHRVIKRPVLRRVVTWVLGVVLVFVFVRVMTYAGYISAVTLPQRYRTIKSPSGARSVLVLRKLDDDETHFDARRAARLDADPDSGEEYTADDMGFVYTAYPPALAGLFYRNNADVEGEITLSYTGNDGTMMVEWLEDESVAHFYVDNPGVAEGGELFVRF